MLYVDNITKTYNNTNENYIALDKISIKFNNQGLYFILGKSGSGKSTLLNIIGGIDKCDSGVITFENQIITKLNQKELNNYRKNSIGYIFQEFNLLTDLNVYDNIALSLKLQGKKENKNEILEILKEVDLEGFENRKISELSGGQKQRVAIARALAKNLL